MIKPLALRQIADTGAIEGHGSIRWPIQPTRPVPGGQGQAVQFFVGQAMKLTAGKANPAQLNELLRRKLDADSSDGDRLYRLPVRGFSDPRPVARLEAPGKNARRTVYAGCWENPWPLLPADRWHQVQGAARSASGR